MPQQQPVEFTIRPVTAESLPGDLARGLLDLPDEIAAALPEQIASNVVRFLVAEGPDGSPRGQVALRYDGARKPEVRERVGDAVGLSFLGVPKAHRRKGIGRALMQAAIDEVEQSDQASRGIFLAVETNNFRAIPLYESLGFVAVGDPIQTTPFIPGGGNRRVPAETAIMVRPANTD